MSGGAELCGRMTNGSLVLLGSGFWEPGQREEPFVHLPVTIAGSDKEQAVISQLITGRDCHQATSASNRKNSYS